MLPVNPRMVIHRIDGVLESSPLGEVARRISVVNVRRKIGGDARTDG